MPSIWLYSARLVLYMIKTRRAAAPFRKHSRMELERPTRTLVSAFRSPPVHNYVLGRWLLSQLRAASHTARSDALNFPSASTVFFTTSRRLNQTVKVRSCRPVDHLQAA